MRMSYIIVYRVDSSYIVLILFIILATNYRALLRKMTYKDKASYDSTPPCISNKADTVESIVSVIVCVLCRRDTLSTQHAIVLCVRCHVLCATTVHMIVQHI